MYNVAMNVFFCKWWNKGVIQYGYIYIYIYMRVQLAKGENKAMVLVESGIRIHKTEYAWPKSMMPSGFSMKMRKHIRTRRIESIRQLGVCINTP